MKFTSILLCSLLLGSASLYAQTKTAESTQLTLGTPEDPHAGKEDFLKATDYLFTHPVDANKEARKKILAYVTAWVANSPDVTLMLKADMVKPFENDENGFLPMYMAAWSRYILQSGDSATAAGHTQGMRDVLYYYKTAANHAQRNKELDKLLKKQEAGTLDAYLAKQADAAE